ncbi:MAG: response regulator [Pseudomonadota bacterium]
MTVFENDLDEQKSTEIRDLSDAAGAAMLSHDIRTSLNGVLGGLSSIDLESLPGDVRLQVQRAHAASLTLASLLSEAFGEACDWTDQHQASASTDLGAFQDFLVKRWHGAAAAEGLSFVMERAGSVPPAVACPVVDLSRIVCNMVSNSIRYTDKGGVAVRFSRPVNGGVLISVEDTGPGVDQEVLDTLASSDFVDALKRDSRMRLGLQIVQALARELEGRFSLSNLPEGGLRAEIWLPETLCLWDWNQSRDAQDSTTPEFPALANRRILLAEDNPTNQMVATQMLTALRANVTVASDGVEALEAFQRDVFDLVIVDIEMPRLTGLDVIREIRSLTDKRSRVPIIALTAYALREHRERIEQAGANGLISKPITGLEALARSLSAYIESPQLSADGKGFAAPDAANGDAVDRQVYDALVVAVGSEMRDELLEKVAADLIGAREELKDALDPIDPLSIRSASHILISVGGAIGANRVLALARDVNACAHGEQFEDLPAFVNQCIGELDRAISFVEGQRAIAEGL